MVVRLMRKILLFGAVVSATTAQAAAWTNVSTYTIETGMHLTYVVVAPQDPQTLKTKLPIVIYEEGDSTTDILVKSAPFNPNVFTAQMGAASLTSGFAWAIPELRTQSLGDNALQICSLDFMHRERDLNAFIDQIKQLSFVDPNEIFLIGHSAGGDTVTHVSQERGDIRGVISLAGGISSCSEEASGADCPPDLQSNLQYQCSESQDSGRTGNWWAQLFLESNLFASISSLKLPYLALIGTDDQAVSVSEFQIHAPLISKRKSNFQSAVLPGLDHESIVTSPQTLQLMMKFVDSNVR